MPAQNTIGHYFESSKTTLQHKHYDQKIMPQGCNQHTNLTQIFLLN
jgi:hypothetical protein